MDEAQKNNYHRVKHVTEPLACRSCEGSCACSKIVAINKLIRPCKCKPICELCLKEEIERTDMEMEDPDTFYNYVCPTCSTRIYFRGHFNSQGVALKQLPPPERCVLFFLIGYGIAILAFGFVVLGFSIHSKLRWIGICTLVLCLILVIYLIPQIINRFTHKFFSKTRKKRRPSFVDNDFFGSGVYFKEITDDKNPF